MPDLTISNSQQTVYELELALESLKSGFDPSSVTY